MLGFEREQVFLMGRERFRAVKREQRVARLDLFAREIDEHLVDPAFELGLHLGDPGLVESDAGGGADLVGYGLVLGASILDTHELLLFGGDVHGAGRTTILVLLLFALVNGGEFHAAIWRDAGFVGLVPG